MNQSKLEEEFVRNFYVQENTGKLNGLNMVMIFCGSQPKIKKYHRIRTYPHVLFLSY